MSSLSHLVANLAERIQKIKCKDCDCFLEYSNKSDEELKKRFRNAFKFSSNDTNKFILLLRKSVYSYECMDEWENFSETSLPRKGDFYGSLTMESITNSD